MLSPAARVIEPLPDQTTTLTLNTDQALALLDALEGRHIHHLTPWELITHDRMVARLEQALDRLQGKPMPY